jgi:hypothetical protein
MIAVPNLQLAPGCFGLAMTYREGARECSACPFASACAPLAAENLTILRAELGINVPVLAVDVAKSHAKVAKADTLIDFVPKKVEAQLARAERLKIQITPALERSENPFKGKKPRFLEVAFHVLLKKIGVGVSREMLVACFMRSLGYSKQTAESHAKQTVQILEAVGAGQESNGIITLRGNTQ